MNYLERSLRVTWVLSLVVAIGQIIPVGLHPFSYLLKRHGKEGWGEKRYDGASPGSCKHWTAGTSSVLDSVRQGVGSKMKLELPVKYFLPSTRLVLFGMLPGGPIASRGETEAAEVICQHPSVSGLFKCLNAEAHL